MADTDDDYCSDCISNGSTEDEGCTAILLSKHLVPKLTTRSLSFLLSFRYAHPLKWWRKTKKEMKDTPRLMLPCLLIFFFFTALFSLSQEEKCFGSKVDHRGRICWYGWSYQSEGKAFANHWNRPRRPHFSPYRGNWVIFSLNVICTAMLDQIGTFNYTINHIWERKRELRATRVSFFIERGVSPRTIWIQDIPK